MNNDHIQLKKEIINILGKDLFLKLRKINQLETLKDASIIIFFGFFSFWFSLNYGGIETLSSVFFLIICCLINSILVNWINVQVHEASHNLLLRDKNLNDLFVNIFLGSWALHDVSTYRSSHQLHHSHLHLKQDPDKEVYNILSGGHFALRIIQDLLGYTALKRIFKIKFKTNTKSKNSIFNNFIINTLPKTIAQIIILIVLFINVREQIFLYYFFLIIVPIFSFFPVLVRIRTVVQHNQVSKSMSNSDTNWTSRTTISNLVERYIIGARMDYHFEHHLFPFIPHYNLRILHQKLSEHDFFNNKYNDFKTDDYAVSALQFCGDRKVDT